MPSSDSESLLLLLVSANSKLGFFSRDFSGVVLDSARSFGFSSVTFFSTTLTSSAELSSSSSPVVGIGVALPGVGEAVTLSSSLYGSLPEVLYNARGKSIPTETSSS